MRRADQRTDVHPEQFRQQEQTSRVGRRTPASTRDRTLTDKPVTAVTCASDIPAADASTEVKGRSRPALPRHPSGQPEDPARTHKCEQRKKPLEAHHAVRPAAPEHYHLPGFERATCCTVQTATHPVSVYGNLPIRSSSRATRNTAAGSVPASLSASTLPYSYVLPV